MTATLFTSKYRPQEPRPPQEAAIEAIQQAWKHDIKALVSMATGTGKTTVTAELLRREISLSSQRALIIGHTMEIINQIARRLRNQFDGRLDEHYTDFYRPGLGIVMGENDEPDARIVVATYQSCHIKRLPRLFKTGGFDYLIIDEAHHAVADNSYGRILGELMGINPHIKVLGLTATPQRSDKTALGTVFDAICFEYLIPSAVDDGYLVKPQRVQVHTQVSVSGVRSNGGDYSTTKLVSVLDTANWVDLCKDAYHEYLDGRRTLGFLPSVGMSQELTRALEGDGIRARHVDGNTPKAERTQILRDFELGDVQIVNNFGVLTEGFDAPACDAILFGRPTRSQTLATQIFGRGLRPYPNKENCLILDMTVVDTKALEKGTLLGNLVHCPQCGLDYYKGYPQCPQCGYEIIGDDLGGGVVGLGGIQAQAKFVGNGLVQQLGSIFESAYGAWYQGVNGYWTASAGFEEAALAISPINADGVHLLIAVPRYGDPRILDRNEDLASLMLDADGLVQARGEDMLAKDAYWRGQPVSDKQLTMFHKYGIPFNDQWTRGTASNALTNWFAYDKIRRWAQSLQTT